jgi:hypothetical protein
LSVAGLGDIKNELQKSMFRRLKMKLTWTDVEPYFEEEKVLVGGQDMYWYQYVWQLLAEHNLTTYYSLVEKLTVYSRIYSTLKIYREFCSSAFEESPDFCLYLDKITDDEETQDIYDALIRDSDSMQTIYDVLETNLGREKVFYSLWITRNPNIFSDNEDSEENQIDSYERYIGILNDESGMNEVANTDLSAGKLASYEWLSNNNVKTSATMACSEPNIVDNVTVFPLLREYITIFLNNAQIACDQEDTRVLFYRGQSDKAYSLTPSVFRNGLLAKEHILIQDMLLNAPDDFSGNESIIERLIKMQHYGLPTRLLDVTMNPLVALFFACSDNGNMDKDGEVIVFYDYMERPSGIDSRCLVALSEYSGSSERQMLGFLTEKGFANPEIGNLSRMVYLPIEAPRNNERIKRQHGAFVVVGIHGREDGNPYQKVCFNLKPLLVKNFGDGISRSIIIPKEQKRQLITELDAFGINHAFLFPELEHQAIYIRNKHEDV